MSLLKINGLTHQFGGLTAVSDFSTEFHGNELMGLIGPNGAGKTTVFNIISGFYKPTEGKIMFKGHSISGMKPHSVTSLGVARTFQNIRLWHDMSLLDNILISQHYNLGYNLFDLFVRNRRYMDNEKRMKSLAIKLLEQLDLVQFIDEQPKNLPYGIQRKIEIARALSVKPSLLLLDEPAAGLNSSDVQELIKLIRWIHKEFDIAIWMIEHQMAVVMSLCSWIQVIDFGKTIAQGTPEEIQNNPAVIKAYLGDDKI
ncbi:MAG: ABC transporter ATP-binding protein [Desulfamplus sp.]|nr:ABC transporter ATP-binding protein [Desulfamplus sp.]